MIVPRYYEDLHILHEKTMPDRAYYIPASTFMDQLDEQREASDRFHSRYNALGKTYCYTCYVGRLKPASGGSGTMRASISLRSHFTRPDMMQETMTR